jgi:hypothetical protein
MEQNEILVIPTLSRAKISRKLSYPIGAKDVSARLATTAQFVALKLHFYSGFEVGLRSGHYEFLRVEYLNNARPSEKWSVYSLHKRPPQYRWEIVVQPVPRILRHRIKQYILNSALMQIAGWLGQRAELAQLGNDILAFFYNEKTEQFVPRLLTHLEPLRNPDR